jgi:membrane protease YdiL (CAAX protease family)
MKEKDKILLKHIGKALLTFVIFYFSAYFQLIPVILFNINLENISGAMNVLLSAFSSCCVLFILFFMYRKDLKNEWKIFIKNFGDNIDAGVICWAIGLFIMMASNIIINMINKGIPGNEETVQSMISALPWLMLINAGILAPLNEEIIFRKAFKNVFKNKWLFVLASGFIFGLMHVLGNVNSWVDILYIIPYGALGGAFAYSYYKTDTVFTPITFHMLHNTVLVLVSIL